MESAQNNALHSREYQAGEQGESSTVSAVQHSAQRGEQSGIAALTRRKPWTGQLKRHTPFLLRLLLGAAYTTRKARSAMGQAMSKSALPTSLATGDHLMYPFLRRLGWAMLLGLSIGALGLHVVQASLGVNDFCQDYIAAQRLLHGEMPYTPLLAPDGTSMCPGLRLYDSHPPFSVLLFLPFALLPASVAAATWGCVSLALSILSGWLMLRALGWPLLRGMALFMFGSLLWSAAVLATDTENFGHLITALVVGAWVLERRQNPKGSGILLGVAGLLKLWPLALLGYALLWRKWRGMQWALLTCAGGLALSFLALGPAAYAAYLGPVQAEERLAVADNANISLVGSVARLFLGFPARQPLPPLLPWLSLPQAVLFAEAIGVLFLLASLLFLWRYAHGVQREIGEPVTLGILVVVLLLAFPVTWFWGLVMLILPGTLTWLALRQLLNPPAWWYALVALGLVPLLLPAGIFLDLPAWVLSFHNSRLLALAHLLTWLPTFGLLLLAGTQAWLLRWAATSRPTGYAAPGTLAEQKGSARA